MNKSQENCYNKWLKLANLQKKDYQKYAISWCLQKETEYKGGLLADEMGLGKSYVMMGLIAVKPLQTLIVVPPALLEQWKEILTKFLHPPSVYHGPQKNKINFGRIVLTTYNLLLRLKIRKKSWERVIYDEAHHLRNHNSEKYMGAERIKSKINWMVTGTPIQNKKNDLYSLCRILRISIKTPIENFCLRRTKEDVGLKLPKITIHNELVDWKTKAETDFALDIHSLLKLTGITGRSFNPMLNTLKQTGGSGFPAIMRARQACVLPELILKNLHQFIITEGLDTEWLTNGYIESLSTSKIDAVISTITKRDNGRSKLVFCHFRKEIDEICERLGYLKVGVIDGRTSKKERQNILKSSTLPNWLCNQITDQLIPNQGSDFLPKLINEYLTYDIAVVQIQSCCEGLNLQQFQEVYFTTPHWNPAVEDQAIARCYRQGQTENVDVFKFCMKFKDNRKTLDEYCLEVQSFKRELWF